MGYKSLIITNKDSQVKSLEDLLANSKNYTFGNGDPNSTSGFLVPAYYIFAKNNIDPKTAFKVVRNASHGANLAAVLNNQVDAATNNTEEMEKLQGDRARQARAAPHPLDLAPHPLGPAGVAQGPRSRGEGEDQDLRRWRYGQERRA